MENRRLLIDQEPENNSLEDKFLNDYDDAGDKEILEESNRFSLNGKESDTGVGSIHLSKTQDSS